MIDFARENKRCAIWAGMGSGKTSAMEYLIALLKLLGDVQGEPWLVLGPMRVAKDTWPEDMARWEQFRDVRIVPLIGSPTQRLDKLKSKADIYTISYELAPWLVEHFGDKWPFRNVIADESDRLKGFRSRQGGQRARSLGRIAHNLTDRWINLTGTPSPNGLKDLWGQTWFLDRGVRLGRTYSSFTDRWFRQSWNGFSIEPMPHSDKEIHAALQDICITIDTKDYFDLKDPIVTRINVKLPEKARKIYKALEKELFATLENGENVEVFNAAALTNKCLQLANGAVYTDYPEWVGVHDEKIEALRSIMGESGGTPLLVSYAFKSDVARIKAAFPGAVEINSTEGMHAFRSGNASMGLAHPKSMGHGIDGLQNVTNILVRYGRGWNLGEEMQMLERIGPMRQRQGGYDRPVWVYDLVAADTIEEDAVDALVAKRNVQDALLRAMRRFHGPN
jgi:SNF2 family DNA or RNA helicase